MLLAASTACTVGPHYTLPSVAVPERWNEVSVLAAAPAALEQWWMEFDDPMLVDLITWAVAGNLDRKIAAARVQEARAARGIAASAAMPQVDATGTYGRISRSDAVPPFKESGGEGSPFGSRDQNVFEAGFDASWEIDVFGGVRRDVEAAIAQVQAAEETERDVRITLLAEVARNYAELRGAQRRLDLVDQTLEAQQETVEIAGARFDAGLGSELDVARARALLEAIGSERPELERIAWQAIYRIGVLVGRQPQSFAGILEAPGPMPPVPPEVPVSLPSELLLRRPDLRRAERDVAAATARIGVARADLFPRFSIRGDFGRLSDDAGELGSGSSQFWAIVPGVRWPILSGGRIRANIRAQTARQEQTLLAYERAVLGALEEVENALSAHTRERRRQESLGASVVANRRAVELATERYVSGLESFLSVLDARRSLYAAEDRLASSETAVVTSLIAVYKALGGGWDPDAPMLAATPLAASK
jgi:NodT family efflux transporter outer membrane factor (OMF) lipoprotein